MASTITLQSTIDYARTFTKLLPAVGVGGFSQQPALFICNRVLQQILSPPFNWRFNRSSISFSTTGVQDEVLVGVTDIGWVERCVLEWQQSDSDPKPRTEIEVVYSLPLTSIRGTPIKVAFQREQGGNAVIRFWPIPHVETPYTVHLDYQRRAPIKTSLSETWAPIPDELSYVYSTGVLAELLKHADDSRAQAELAQFYQSIAQALRQADAERRGETIFPERPLMIG